MYEQITIIAKTHPGEEFVYSSRSAHKAPKASANRIRDILNKCHHKLDDGEIWHVYNVDSYCMAYAHAQYQRFSIRNGHVTETIG